MYSPGRVLLSRNRTVSRPPVFGVYSRHKLLDRRRFVRLYSELDQV